MGMSSDGGGSRIRLGLGVVPHLHSQVVGVGVWDADWALGAGWVVCCQWGTPGPGFLGSLLIVQESFPVKSVPVRLGGRL
jgi:hypothetical protein